MTTITSGTNLSDFVRCRQSAWVPLAATTGLRPLDTPDFAEAGLDLNNEENFNRYYTHLSDFGGHTWGA